MISLIDQINLYKKYGVKINKINKIPLFFDDYNFKSKLTEPLISNQKYFIVLAQNLYSKGIYYLPQILKYLDKNIEVKILFKSESEKIFFLKILGSQKVKINSNIELIYNINILKSGKSLLRNSFAVINPSCWTSTTEFVLLEALSMGKPMFCFNTGIHKEIYNKFNLKASCFDCKEFANNINYFFDNHEDYLEISKYSEKILNVISFNENHIDELQRIFSK